MQVRYATFRAAPIVRPLLIWRHWNGTGAGSRPLVELGAVVDGMVWCQSFVNLHEPEAVRMLDFAHAAEYLTALAQTSGLEGLLLSRS